MKQLLGAIAAAMLLGVGCAHERGNQTQTDMPASPQASVDSSVGAGGAGTAGGLDCPPINGEAGIGGSASEAGAVDDTTISGSDAKAGAIEDDSFDSKDTNADIFEDTGMGGGGGGGG